MKSFFTLSNKSGCAFLYDAIAAFFPQLWVMHLLFNLIWRFEDVCQKTSYHKYLWVVGSNPTLNSFGIVQRVEQ